jgi:hypothetical protein
VSVPAFWAVSIFGSNDSPTVSLLGLRYSVHYWIPLANSSE